MNEQLEAAGFKIKEVVAVDATLVAAHSKPCGDFAGDEEASWRGFPAKEVIDASGYKAIARRPALYGWIKTKYYGLEKNYLAATLTALSWNMKKWACLSAAGQFAHLILRYLVLSVRDYLKLYMGWRAKFYRSQSIRTPGPR